MRGGYADIFGYDLASEAELPVCTAVGNQSAPDITGNTVVWQVERGGGNDIYRVTLAR